MKLALIWALASTFGAGVNDLLFKRFTRRPGGLGPFIAGTGLVYAALIAAMYGPSVLTPNARTLAYGLIAGILSVSANIALVRALQGLDATIGATIYRLNFVVVMCLAVPILGEPFSAPKLAGLTAATLAVLLFARDGRKGALPVGLTCLGLAVAASLTRACMGIVYKLALMHGVDCNGFIFLNALCWLFGGVIWAMLTEHRLRIDARGTRYALVSGVLVAEIVVTLAHALEHGQASIVVPITQLSFLGTVLLSTVFLSERLNRTRLLGLVCGVAAVFALMQA